MKKTALAVVFAFTLTLVSGAKAAQYDYRDFEGLPYDPPIFTLVSPSPNATINAPDVPVNVTVQIRGWIYCNIERIRCLNYSLDGQTRLPMALIVPSDLASPYSVYGNVVLAGVSDGTHDLTIWGETFIGGMTCYFNETVSFRVNTSKTPQPETEPFPTTLIIGSAIAVAAVAGLGLLIYLKKRKR